VVQHHVVYSAIQQNKIREHIESLKGQYRKGTGIVHMCTIKQAESLTEKHQTETRFILQNMNNKESSATNITPELFPRILFCNGLGLLAEKLHKECSLIGTSRSRHSSSASSPERRKKIRRIPVSQRTNDLLKITISSLHD
jgi:hypothetical protein